jgi:hypothetical protein
MILVLDRGGEMKIVVEDFLTLGDDDVILFDRDSLLVPRSAFGPKLQAIGIRV